MADNWTHHEVDVLVADYLDMLGEELRGQSTNKTASRRALAALLPGRTSGSIEFKRANVSAALIDLGFPYVNGYKPRSNYQHLLRDVVANQLGSQPGLLHAAAQDAIEAPNISFDDILAALADPPLAKVHRVTDRESTAYRPRPNPLPVNYLEIEARNRHLGLLGEHFVVSFEQARLARAGHERLASQVDHVSVSRGDGLGYDVLSFDESGAERLIEVKTTKNGADTPFFLSRNEVAVSDTRAPQCHLYRVYNLRQRARLFTLPGSLLRSCVLEPESYIARVA